MKFSDLAALTNLQNPLSKFSDSPPIPPTSTFEVTDVAHLQIIDTDYIPIENLISQKAKSQSKPQKYSNLTFVDKLEVPVDPYTYSISPITHHTRNKKPQREASIAEELRSSKMTHSTQLVPPCPSIS